jgi:hypothetical protein
MHHLGNSRTTEWHGIGRIATQTRAKCIRWNKVFLDSPDGNTQNGNRDKPESSGTYQKLGTEPISIQLLSNKHAHRPKSVLSAAAIAYTYNRQCSTADVEILSTNLYLCAFTHKSRAVPSCIRAQWGTDLKSGPYVGGIYSRHRAKAHLRISATLHRNGIHPS